MSFVDRFEKAVSQGVNAPFSKFFSGTIKLVDVLDAIRGHIEENKAELSDNRVVIPNRFIATLNPEELQQLINTNSSQFITNLCTEITDYAAEQEYTLVGAVTIETNASENIQKGTLQITGEIKRGAAAPVNNVAPTPETPILEIAGQQWALTDPVTVIGRGSEADIVISDSGVSRRHLEIRITPHGVIANDLGSTNGTFVEGHRIKAATLLDGNELTIGRTHILFWTSTEGSDQLL